VILKIIEPAGLPANVFHSQSLLINPRGPPNDTLQTTHWRTPQPSTFKLSAHQLKTDSHKIMHWKYFNVTTMFTQYFIFPTIHIQRPGIAQSVKPLAKGWRPRCRSLSLCRVKNFHFSMLSRLALWSTQPPIQWIPWALSPGVKRVEREANQSPANSGEVKKRWVLHPLSHTSLWRSA
jgi:hypothetical protein